eukprot:TRINITY_DN11308_c0_g1_i2.p1 TRINITY_DN11308_c0_g1~~TRINITY_DN11308_c0_g1_i2.p1  ORF type:complete len:813 (-),score=247.72 TRINITY_DN11308_c0_g1_i2:139-2577(-)
MAVAMAPLRRQQQLAVRQLEQLRGRQALSEQRLQEELDEASSELRELQANNSYNVEEAEQELMQLSELLQQSLQKNHLLEERAMFLEARERDLQTEEHFLEVGRQQALRQLEEAHGQATFGSREEDLATEHEERERLLQLVEEKRVLTKHLSRETEVLLCNQSVLQLEATALRTGLDLAGKREAADCGLRRKEDLRLASKAFLMFNLVTKMSKRQRVLRSKTQRRSLQTAGLEAMKEWRSNAAARACWRRRLEDVNWCFVAEAFRCWLRMALEERWTAKCLPTALRMRSRSLTRIALQLWRHTLQMALRRAAAPAWRHLRAAALRAWRRAVAALRWEQWICRHFLRRRTHSCLQASCRGWRHAARRKVYQKRITTEFTQSRLARRLPLLWRAWRRWLADVQRQAGEKLPAQRRCFEGWRKRTLGGVAACRQAELLLAAWERRCTETAFMMFSEAAARARFARRVVTQRQRRASLEVIYEILLPTWHLWTRLSSKFSKHHKARRREALAAGLSRWRSSATTLRAAEAARRERLTWQKRRCTQAQCAAMRDWQLSCKRSRCLRARALTVSGRGRLALLQAVWAEWLHLLHAAQRERRCELAAERVEAQRQQSKQQDALQEAESCSNAADMARLRLVDDLHEALREAAAAEVEHREAVTAKAALRRATEGEAEQLQRMAVEAAALRAANEEFLQRRTALRSSLQERLNHALQGPEMLRERLRRCEAEAHSRGRAEMEAEDCVGRLCQELEELHSTAGSKLRRKDAEVAGLFAEVEITKRSEQELSAELAQRRQALHRQELRAEGSVVFSVHASAA